MCRQKRRVECDACGFTPGRGIPTSLLFSCRESARLMWSLDLLVGTRGRTTSLRPSFVPCKRTKAPCLQTDVLRDMQPVQYVLYERRRSHCIHFTHVVDRLGPLHERKSSEDTCFRPAVFLYFVPTTHSTGLPAGYSGKRITFSFRFHL